jgi:hypothetical protein
MEIKLFLIKYQKVKTRVFGTFVYWSVRQNIFFWLPFKETDGNETSGLNLIGAWTVQQPFPMNDKILLLKTNMFNYVPINLNKCHSCQTAGNSNFTLF